MDEHGIETAVELAQARLLRVAGEWLSVTEPNQEIDGFHASALRDICGEIATAVVSDKEVDALLLDALSRLPIIDIDYGETGREALVIKARIADLQSSVLNYYQALVAQKGLVTAPIDADIRAQLETIRVELTHARTDLTSLKRGIASRSGLSPQFGVVSVEIDAAISKIGGALLSLGTIVPNLGTLKSALDAIKQRIAGILSFTRKQLSAFGKELVHLAESAAISASRALVAGAEAFQHFLAVQTDKTKIPVDPLMFQEKDRAVRPSPRVRNHDDVAIWLRLNHAPSDCLSGLLFRLKRMEPTPLSY